MIHLFVSLFVFSGLAQCTEMDEIRARYHTLENKHQVQEFMEFTHQEHCDAAIPYRASALMMMAKFKMLPNQKLSYFNKGKALLEGYIARFPKDLEARYIRLLVQSESRAFLHYKENIPEDLEFVQQALPGSDLPEAYKEKVYENIKTIHSD